MDIYLKDIKRKDNEILGEFLNRLFTTRYGFPATYYDKTCIELQCNNGKSRSFSEIYHIVKKYFPRLTREVFAINLKEFILFNNKFSLINCPDINKIVVYKGFRAYNPDNKNQYYCDRLVYNYGGHATRKKNNKGKGEHSLMEILELMGYSKRYLKYAMTKHPNETR